VGKSKELFSIDTSGESKRLTYLSQYFNQVSIYEWHLSPDKQKLAFLASMENQHDGKTSLYILDLKSGELMDPCLKGPEMVSPNGRFDLTTFYGPVWSPDSQHILLENRTAEDASRLLYVDLANQFAVHIASNTQPLGWMADSNP